MTPEIRARRWVKETMQGIVPASTCKLVQESLALEFNACYRDWAMRFSASNIDFDIELTAKAVEGLLDFKYRRTNFIAQLYELIAKASFENRALLRRAFPVEVYIFEAWSTSEDEVAFFAYHGLTLRKEMVDRL